MYIVINASLKIWLIHVNVWQKPLQYCKVISLQLIKINEKKSKNQKRNLHDFLDLLVHYTQLIFLPREGCKLNTNQLWSLPLPSTFISQLSSRNEAP